VENPGFFGTFILTKQTSVFGKRFRKRPVSEKKITIFHCFSGNVFKRKRLSVNGTLCVRVMKAVSWLAQARLFLREKQEKAQELGIDCGS